MAVYGIKDNKSLEKLLCQTKTIGTQVGRQVDFEDLELEEGGTYLIYVHTSLGTRSGMKGYQTSLEWIIDGQRYENENGDREYVLGNSRYADSSVNVIFSECFIMECPDNRINGVRFSVGSTDENYGGNSLRVIRID